MSFCFHFEKRSWIRSKGFGRERLEAGTERKEREVFVVLLEGRKSWVWYAVLYIFFLGS